MYDELIERLKERFEENTYRYSGISWEDVEKIITSDDKLITKIKVMEETGGEVDMVKSQAFDSLVIVDCAKESPQGRRSLCYDKEARINRKKNAPDSSVMELADKIGVNILNESQYYGLQELFEFDLKSSSWVLTEDELRDRGGAIFCEKRYGRTFTFHNGAYSYYSSRGFRAYVSLTD